VPWESEELEMLGSAAFGNASCGTQAPVASQQVYLYQPSRDLVPSRNRLGYQAFLWWYFYPHFVENK